MQAIINGEMYEVEPAVKVILDRVMTENAELKRENKRLEEAFQKATGVIAATDCVKCKNKEHINDVNYAISYIRDFCKDRKCKTCPISIDGRCSLGGLTPKGWENSIKVLDEEIYGAIMDGGAE
jgi:hypothetical protein